MNDILPTSAQRCRRWAQAWDAWWFAEGPPHALAIARIGMGIYLFIAALPKLPFVPMLFSREGLLILSDRVAFLPMADTLFRPSAAIAWLLFALYLGAIIALTIGWRMRTAIAVLLLLTGYQYVQSLHLYWVTYEKLGSFFLVILLWSGADKTWSLRMAREHGSWTAWEPVSLLPQRFIALQVTATYLGVGWQKVWLPAWQSGEVLAYSLASRWGTPPAFWLMQRNVPMAFFDAGVLLVKLFETTIAPCLWIPGLRRWYMLGGILFHVFIAVMLSIWQFLVLVPLYALFFPPESIPAWCAAHLPALAGRRVLASGRA